MKKLLFSILMVAVIMPSLVCGMTLCDMSAQAAPSDRSSSMPCHEDGIKKSGALMFLKDCMGVDLMQAKDEAHPDLANQDIDVIHYTIIQNNVLQLTNFITTHTIRGPPEFDRHRSVTPSILLGTQRFRI